MFWNNVPLHDWSIKHQIYLNLSKLLTPNRTSTNCSARVCVMKYTTIGWLVSLISLNNLKGLRVRAYYEHTRKDTDNSVNLFTVSMSVSSISITSANSPDLHTWIITNSIVSHVTLPLGVLIIYRDCFSTSTKKWAFCQIFHTNFIPSNWYHKIQ